jgi:DNA-binding CsgD family transcriptional regulator
MEPSSDLIHCLYEAPGSEGGWQRFLELLGLELGGAVTVLMAYDRKQRGADVSCIAGISEEGLAKYSAYYAGLNPWLSTDHERVFLDGRVHLGEELVHMEELRKMEFFHDFGRKHGIVYSMGLVSLQPGAGVIPVLGANRGEPQGSFREREVGLMESVARHLHRALEWEARESQYQRLQGLFDDLPDATWELDDLGRVRRASHRAVAAMAAESVVRLRQGMLQYRGTSAFEKVTELIRHGVEGALVPAGYLSLRRALGGGYVVVYREISNARTGPLNAMSRSYGLTEAELRLLGELLEGGGLKQVADRLGVSLNTVKTQLGSLFSKTGAKRQAELVRMVSRLG